MGTYCLPQVPMAAQQAQEPSDREKKETQNERCWISYMESHQRESRSEGNMMSRNGTGGTDRGRGGLAAVACFSLLVSRLLGPTLMIWDTPALCPAASPLLPQFISLSFSDFPPSFIHMETVLKAPVYTSAHILLFNLTTSSHCILLHKLRKSLPRC